MFLSFKYRRYVVGNTVPWLTLVYAMVILYASLHPVLALRFDGSISWAFLSHRWNWLDINLLDNLSNFLAYLPLGFGLACLMLGSRANSTIHRANTLITTSAPTRNPLRNLGWHTALVLLTTLLASSYSLSIEVLQSFSPQRVSSTIDVACNGLGGFMGAVLASSFKGRRSWIMQQIHRAFAPHSGATFAVLGLWGLAQLNPQGWAFMTAPLAQLAYTFLPAQAQGFAVVLNAQQLHNLESVACIVALMNMLSLLRLALHPALQAWQRLSYLGLTLGLIVAWQIIVYTLQFGAQGWETLFSTAVLESLSLVLGLLLAWAVLPSTTVLVLTVLLLAVHIALAQMLPAHPYMISSPVWQQARLKHLHGLSNLMSAVWPILALLAVMLQAKTSTHRDKHR
jgi:VanZ family protein